MRQGGAVLAENKPPGILRRRGDIQGRENIPPTVQGQQEGLQTAENMSREVQARRDDLQIAENMPLAGHTTSNQAAAGEASGRPLEDEAGTAFLNDNTHTPRNRLRRKSTISYFLRRLKPVSFFRFDLVDCCYS
jgi:hypothetical protein